jgi:hypothetical protein
VITAASRVLTYKNDNSVQSSDLVYSIERSGTYVRRLFYQLLPNVENVSMFSQNIYKNQPNYTMS